MYPWLAWIALSAAMLAACAWDWRQRRIPNAVVVTALLAGLALQGLSPPGVGLFDAAQPGGLGWLSPAGAVLAMALIGLVLWRAGFFGAGDAKLLAAAAAFLGLPGLVPLLLLTLVGGGLLAMASLVTQRSAVLAWLSPERPAPMPTRLPYSLAIAAGALGQAAMACAGVALW